MAIFRFRRGLTACIPFTGTPPTWNELIACLPLPHLLADLGMVAGQGQIRLAADALCVEGSDKQHGNPPVAQPWFSSAACRSGGFAPELCVLYIPKGPNLDWNDAALRQRVLDDLQAFAKRQGAIFVKLDPDVALGHGRPRNGGGGRV